MSPPQETPSHTPSTRILFVCTGNICRSPTAEAVVRRMAADAGMADALVLDSAGTGDWHLGEPPDPRGVTAAKTRGYQLDGIRARLVRPRDFEDFDRACEMDDYRWAMDHCREREFDSHIEGQLATAFESE